MACCGTSQSDSGAEKGLSPMLKTIAMFPWRSPAADRRHRNHVLHGRQGTRDTCARGIDRRSFPPCGLLQAASSTARISRASPSACSSASRIAGGLPNNAVRDHGRAEGRVGKRGRTCASSSSPSTLSATPLPISRTTSPISIRASRRWCQRRKSLLQSPKTVPRDL